VPTGTGRRYRTTSRSVRLFRSFLKEQSEPAVFYGDLAADTVAEVLEHHPLEGATVVDVGCGPAEFARAFRAEGAQYVGLDVDVHTPGTAERPHAIAARGEHLPFADGCADVVMSSNVMEHVPAPGVLGREMIRVARPGGLVFISYTAWWSPHGGHETAPWHYLGGEYAARRYAREHGHEPKNRWGRSLYAAHVGEGMAWARRQPDVDVVALVPRYHPQWATGILHVPLVREVLTWNLLMVLRRR
jgi:SAM-dependent methyltransferase